MKSVFLIRHSKAEEEASSDFDRKLTSDGKKLAKKIAGTIKIIPGIHSKLISSPALRAIETAKVFAEEYRISTELIEKNDFLYKYSSVDRFLLFLGSYEDKTELWIFGHNPMLSDIVSYLSDNKIISMPKCAVAAFQTTAITWLEATSKNTKLIFFENPKNNK
jgi:phosphohistidine phosphatase